jgi:hypothetical protein
MVSDWVVLGDAFALKAHIRLAARLHRTNRYSAHFSDAIGPRSTADMGCMGLTGEEKNEAKAEINRRQNKLSWVVVAKARTLSHLANHAQVRRGKLSGLLDRSPCAAVASE